MGCRCAHAEVPAGACNSTQTEVMQTQLASGDAASQMHNDELAEATTQSPGA